MILLASLMGLVAVLYGAAVLAGSVIGSAIGLKWTSGTAIRILLALILVSGGVQMLLRAF